jgi:phenylalanyl-tRNA synthetase alpha chain
VVPGRVYRPDTPDATHVPMFHQLEGLAIDEDITLADLQGCLLQFARQMFGEATEVRLRPGYFPFTEPSVEVDVSCFRCGGTGFEGAQRCGTCKGEGWIEILGSGMVDPNVLDYVAGKGYDNERVQGFAWGMGIERIAMLVHEVPDLRMLYENDLRLLEQFGAGP